MKINQNEPYHSNYHPHAYMATVEFKLLLMNILLPTLFEKPSLSLVPYFHNFWLF